VFDQKVKAQKVTTIDVIIQNPKMNGTFKYTFSMHTLNYKAFGEPFEFILTVKGIKEIINAQNNNILAIQRLKQGWGRFFKKKPKYGKKNRKPQNKGIFSNHKALFQNNNNFC